MPVFFGNTFGAKGVLEVVPLREPALRRLSGRTFSFDDSCELRGKDGHERPDPARMFAAMTQLHCERTKAAGCSYQRDDERATCEAAAVYSAGLR
jgi:hypothetical protein